MEKMEPGAVSHSMACDRIEVAIGMAATGAKLILIRPTNSGQAVWPAGVAISDQEARRLAADLLHLVGLLDATKH